MSDEGSRVRPPNDAWQVVCADRDEWKRRALKAEDGYTTMVEAPMSEIDALIDQVERAEAAGARAAEARIVAWLRAEARRRFESVLIIVADAIERREHEKEHG